MKSAVRWMSMRKQWLASKQWSSRLRNDHILALGEVFKTSLTFWNSFNIRFAILLTLCHTCCCTWPTIPNALATPTNSNAHVSPNGSKIMRCTQGIHCKYVHLFTAHSSCYHCMRLYFLNVHTDNSFYLTRPLVIHMRVYTIDNK